MRSRRPQISSLDRRPNGQHKSAQKSRIANGSALVIGADHRSAWMRRLKETLAEHLSDHPDPSVAARSLIRRASVLEVSLEQMESEFATHGEATLEQLDTYGRIASNLRRLLQTLGLDRKQRLVGPTLGELLRQDISQHTAEDAS